MIQKFLTAWKRLLTAAILLFLPAGSPATHAEAVPQQTYATAPDGVRIAIQEYGNPKGPEIVLIHGLDGSHLDWTRQTASLRLSKYRLITYDLRGHGLSAKPVQPAYYAEGKRWGDELHTVLAAMHLTHPVLVGWSLGGPIMTNYLQTYGDAQVAGLVFVDGVIELKPEFIKSHPATTAALKSPDLSTYLEGTRQFVRQCFYRQPDARTFALFYANAALASPDMMKALQSGLSVPATTALPKVTAPALFIYGKKDELLDERTIGRAKQLMPRLKVIVYPDTGHASFFEQPDRFNRDLDHFVHQVNKRPRT